MTVMMIMVVVARQRVTITRHKRHAKQHTRDTLNTKCSQRLPQNVIEFAVFHPSSQSTSQPAKQPQSLIHPQHCWLVVVVCWFVYFKLLLLLLLEYAAAASLPVCLSVYMPSRQPASFADSIPSAVHTKYTWRCCQRTAQLSAANCSAASFLWKTYLCSRAPQNSKIRTKTNQQTSCTLKPAIEGL